MTLRRTFLWRTRKACTFPQLWLLVSKRKKQKQILGTFALHYLLMILFSGSWECSAISTAVKSVFICDFWDKPLLSILITFLSLIWFSLCPQIQFASKLYQLLVKPPPEHMQYTAFLCGINCSSNSRGPQPLRASSPHEKRRERLSISRPPRPWGRCHAGLSPAEQAAKGPGTSWSTALLAAPRGLNLSLWRRQTAPPHTERGDEPKWRRQQRRRSFCAAAARPASAPRHYQGRHPAAARRNDRPGRGLGARRQAWPLRLQLNFRF